MDSDVAAFYSHGNPAKDRAAILLRRLEERPGRCVRQHENGRVTLHETNGGTLSTYAADALAVLTEAGKLVRNDAPKSGYASWVPAASASPQTLAAPVETPAEPEATEPEATEPEAPAEVAEAPARPRTSGVDAELPAFGEGVTVADVAAWLDLSDKGASDWLRRQVDDAGERRVREWYLDPKQPRKGIRFECCPALVEALEERGLSVSVDGVVMNGAEAPVPVSRAAPDAAPTLIEDAIEAALERDRADAPTVDLGLFGDGRVETRPDVEAPPLICYDADSEGNLTPVLADDAEASYVVQKMHDAFERARRDEADELAIAAQLVRKLAAGLALALHRADVSIDELARRLAAEVGGDVQDYIGSLEGVLTHDPDVEIDLRLIAQIETLLGVHMVTLTDGAGERLDHALAGLRDRTIYAVQQDLQDAPDADAAVADAHGEADRIDAVLDHALAVVADCRWHLRPRHEREA